MRISDWSSDVCSSDLLADHAVPGVHQKHVIAIADPAQMARRGPLKPIMPGIGDDVARAVIGGRYTPAGLPGTIAIAPWPHVARPVQDMTVTAALVHPGLAPVLAIVASVCLPPPPAHAPFPHPLHTPPPTPPP